MLQQSYVGAMYTRRDSRVDGSEARQTAGVDVRLATNRFAGSQNLAVTSWFLYASRLTGSAGNAAFGTVID